MKIGIIILSLTLCFCGRADAQLQGNKLCIHSGGEYYVNGPFYGFPNHGSTKYFPSFIHWASTSVNNGGQSYPWKIAGYSWAGLQGKISSNIWHWESCLQASADNPWSPNMSYDYPVLYQNGSVPASGWPMPLYGGIIPSYTPAVGGNYWPFPSSMGGFNSYLNIFAAAAGTWNIPSTRPFYSWLFSYNWGCATSSVLTIPSNTSVWEALWVNKGVNHLYCVLDGDSLACDGSGGNKGRNYSLVTDPDNSMGWAWFNKGSGVNSEWEMCIFVCDVVTVPANYPGSSNSTNPFLAYGFDVGPATITPFMSSGKMSLGFMTEDWANESAGMPRVMLGGFGFSGGASGPYGLFNFRIPFAWDLLTTTLANNTLPLFMHTPTASYPACMWGVTTGGHSLSWLLPNTVFVGMEIRWASFPANPLAPMSASYMATYF